jgi:hypothetical protein
MGVIFEVERLKKEAQALRDILLKYKDQEPDADFCLKVLDPIIKKVLEGKTTAPIPKKDITCGYYFTEGSLRPISGMLDAYANFDIHITGMDTDESRKWFTEMRKKI